MVKCPDCAPNPGHGVNECYRLVSSTTALHCSRLCGMNEQHIQQLNLERLKHSLQALALSASVQVAYPSRLRCEDRRTGARFRPLARLRGRELHVDMTAVQLDLLARVSGGLGRRLDAAERPLPVASRKGEPCAVRSFPAARHCSRRFA